MDQSGHDGQPGCDRQPGRDSRSVITLCDTCAFAPDQKLHEGRTGGEIFSAHVEAAAARAAAVATRRFSCLMGCEHSCNAAVSAPGKLTYVLGRFEPTAEAAEALVAFAALHAESETGQVPFKSWPQGVKGHFVSRVPPLAE